MFRVEQVRGTRVTKETRGISQERRAREVAERYVEEGCDEVFIFDRGVLVARLSSTWEPEPLPGQGTAIILVMPLRYDQCDETCTVDCGHCKGQPPAEHERTRPEPLTGQYL